MVEWCCSQPELCWCSHTRGASLEHEEAELEADAIPIESAPLLAEREEDLYGTLV